MKSVRVSGRRGYSRHLARFYIELSRGGHVKELIEAEEFVRRLRKLVQEHEAIELRKSA